MTIQRPDIDAIEARAAKATAGPWRKRQGTKGDRFRAAPIEQYTILDGRKWVMFGLVVTRRDSVRGTSVPVSDGEGTADFILESRLDIPALCAYVRELEAKTAWQPISTAPRDNTWVELRGSSGMRSYPYRVMIACYVKERERYPLRNPELGYDEDAWRTVLGGHVTDDGDMPTHWRPTEVL